MAKTIRFRNEVIARQAVNDCMLLGYWGYIAWTNPKETNYYRLVCHDDAAPTIELRFKDDIIPEL